MTAIKIQHSGWPENRLETLDESVTLTHLKIQVGSTVVTSNFAPSGGENDAIVVPLSPLARTLADHWWVLLYEPLRNTITDPFRARHRLDVGMKGYVFPTVALCSGGEEAISVAWAAGEHEHSTTKFLAAASSELVQMSRSSTEVELMGLIEATIERLRAKSIDHDELLSAWDRVRESMADESERQYCMAAGRLGIDPYDADSPDLAALAGDLSESLFQDISDVVDISELSATTSWLRDNRSRVTNAPTIDLSAFGATVGVDRVDTPPWTTAIRAANAVRSAMGASIENPRAVVENLLGSLVTTSDLPSTGAADDIWSVTSRDGNSARIATRAVSARQRRFRSCAAAYLARVSASGEQRAGTWAHTRKQQVSRAFAAELLAPREFLKLRAGKHGFTSDAIEGLAGELICPHDTVLWQSYNAGIPLPGVALPASARVETLV